MAAPTLKSGLTATPPTFALKGAHNSLFMVMNRLGANPASGRLLRGLTPYLDEQGASHVFLFTERRRREPWGADPEQRVTYQELVHWARAPDGGVYHGVATTTNLLKQDEVIQAFEYEPLHLVEWAAKRMDAAIISSHAPLRLTTAEVPKPWGRELWYTGIEQRGVSAVLTPHGRTPLPYALGMFPVPLIGEKEVPPILLKTLQPYPEPLYGDLYLEVHREKWEVYVVVDVDRTAWPDGVGCLRAGLDAPVVERYHQQHGTAWQDALAADLTAAIAAYEEVRRAIDDELAGLLEGEGLDAGRPVPPEVHKRLLEHLPADLSERERERREAVEAFLGRVPLRTGDVVTLPPRVLHSLRHGVSVVEFQTPTYERLIAMFGQRVLTQPHWDTEEAVALMHKAVFESQALTVLKDEDGVRVERIVDFPRFQVERLAVAFNRHLPQRTQGNNRYRLLYVTEGKGELVLPGGATYPLEPGAVYMLPAALGDYTVSAITAQGVACLQAEPLLDAPEQERPEAIDDRLSRVW